MSETENIEHKEIIKKTIRMDVISVRSIYRHFE